MSIDLPHEIGAIFDSGHAVVIQFDDFGILLAPVGKNCFSVSPAGQLCWLPGRGIT
jgi:hypothetical protein